jgi:hypothetical protein
MVKFFTKTIFIVLDVFVCIAVNVIIYKLYHTKNIMYIVANKNIIKESSQCFYNIICFATI